MKYAILAATLALTPITGHTANKDQCEAVKAIASLCVLMRKADFDQDMALMMFKKFNTNTQKIAKVICSGIYELDNIELLSDEGVANAFYKNCME